MSETTHIFNVRGRPVGFEPGHFGGALVAVERGYFPVSSTGYRSLAGHFGIDGEADPAAISPEFLEALAAAQDRTRRTLLAQLGRRPVAGTDRLSNFISVSIEAEAALTEGFFARDDERAALWRGAFQRLSLIDTDGRFQPAPTTPAWTRDGCAEALAARRVSLAFLRRLGAKVLERTQLLARQFGEPLALRCELENFSAPLRDFAAEKFGELAQLPAVLALPHRIARSRLGDTAGVAHFDQNLQPIQ